MIAAHLINAALLEPWQTFRSWPNKSFAVTGMSTIVDVCGGIVRPVALLLHSDSGSF